MLSHLFAESAASPQLTRKHGRTQNYPSCGAIACVMLACVLSCQSKKTRAIAPAPTEETAPGAAHFGAPLGASARHPIAEVLANPTQYADQTLQIDGHVRRACSRKGCWMELAAGPEATQAGCRVTFKDYSFFVPTDSAGAKARVEGKLVLKRLGPAKVAHYESEGAHFADKAADGSAHEVQFIAQGVDLWR